jgi:hypothetical protein
MPSKQEYWFPAKRYGWGWGLPATWQGWLALAIFFALLWTGAATILPRFGNLSFVAYSGLLSLLLVGLCWLKGEPPRWRMGRDPEK